MPHYRFYGDKFPSIHFGLCDLCVDELQTIADTYGGKDDGMVDVYAFLADIFDLQPGYSLQPGSASKSGSVPYSATNPTDPPPPLRDSQSPPVSAPASTTPGVDTVDGKFGGVRDGAFSDGDGGNGGSDVGLGTKGGEYGNKTAALEAENARLKEDLAVFDLGFFEEVEDLKYSYVKLKRGAKKLAENQVGVVE